MPTSTLESILVVPDVHIPFHDQRAWKLFMQAAKFLKPKRIYIIGDFMDFYAVSDHSKDPVRATQFAEEIQVGEKALDELDGLGADDKEFIGGNHEDRLQRYLQTKAPELFGMISVPELLHLKRRGWKYVPYKSDTHLGKIALTHDIGVAGRYSVYRSLDNYQNSCITGHSHRFAYIVEGNATGEFKLSAQFGWLGDTKQIHYMQAAKVKKDWALGFGHGYYDPATGIVYLVPVPIVKYTCMVNGRLFKG